jgi:DNA modification methylase
MTKNIKISLIETNKGQIEGLPKNPRFIKDEKFKKLVKSIEENEPITKLGDIWQLGRHRLMCGDSTDKETVELLMDGKKADMVFTDPPYGMKKEADGVLNDNLNYDDLLAFNKQWIPLTFEALKDNGSWYCWGIDEPLMDIYSHILKPMQRENKITFRNFITWKKENDNPTMLFNGACSSNKRSFYTNEKCLFVMCGVQCLTLNADQYWEKYEPIRKYLYDERIKCGWDIPIMKTIAGHSDKSRDHWTSKSQWNLPTKDVYEKFQAWARNNGVKAFEREYESLRREYESLRREYESLRAYFDGTASQCIDVWVHDVTSQKERELTGGHATPKPIALCSRAIKSSSRENESVLDVFGGSGSTLIACEQLDRTCYMMELDPKYCDVIIKRWETLTGEKAVKLN